MRFLLFALLLSVILDAKSLDEIIGHALQTHTSLVSIQERLSAVENEKSMSRNFSDPDIAFGINDIQFDNPAKRDLEAMQFTSVTFKQKIPYFGKRDAATNKAKAKEKVLQMSLEEAKSELKKEIRLTAYAIWEAQGRAKILYKYIADTSQSIALNEAYNLTSNSHIALMSAKLSLSRQKIEKSVLNSLIDSLFQKLSYLAGEKVESLALDLGVQKPKELFYYLQKVQADDALQVKKAQVELQKSQLQIAHLSQKIDPYVQAGYYYRQGHPDYTSITVGASIPLWGTQKEEEQIQRKLLLAADSEANDFQNRLTSQISQLYANLQSDFQIYRILTEESMPQIEHLVDLQKSSVKSGDVLLLYIDLLNKELGLEESLIKVTADFNKKEALLDALTGE